MFDTGARVKIKILLRFRERNIIPDISVKPVITEVFEAVRNDTEIVSMEKVNQVFSKSFVGGFFNFNVEVVKEDPETSNEI